MYDEEVKRVEELFKLAVMRNINDETIKYVSDLADLIIKIKTIQAIDVSADLIRVSREVGKN